MIMTGKKASSAIFLLAAAGPLAMQIHGFEFKYNSLGRPKTLVVDASTRSSRYKSKIDSPPTVVSSKINAGEFKDINIDDVLLEAENALNAAQTSMVDVDENTNEETSTDFKEINIDDVLLEAENALNAAQISLVDETNEKKGGAEFGNLKNTIRDSLLDDDKGGKSSVEVTEILSSTLGGILLGSLLGSYATFSLSDIDLLSPESFSSDILELVIPIIACIVLGGITGFAGSMQENSAGIIVRNVLGVPTRALASAIVGSIQDAARRQVEKTANDIKSIPSNVANSAKETAVQKAREAKLSVDSAIESAIESLIEKLKQVVLVAAILSSLVVTGVYFTNGQLDFPHL